MADDANLTRKVSGERLQQFKQEADKAYVTKAALTAALGTKLSKEDALNLFYPVGSIYMSSVDTDPADIFGAGTWAPVADAFCYMWTRTA